MNKKKVGIIAGISAAVIIVGVLGYRYFFGGSDSAGETVYVNSVNALMGVGGGTGLQNRFSGVVESQESWSVEKEGDRPIKEIHVKVGDEVKKGDVLVTYDVSSTEADLSEAQLALEKLQNEISSAQTNIANLQKEKAAASADSQLSYTMEIQQLETDIKRNEYSISSKKEEIKKLKKNAKKNKVKSKIDGVIKTINKEDSNSYNASESNALITVMQVGNYRVKGSVNEQNARLISAGSPAIIRSRVDNTQIWKGTMGAVDREAPNKASEGGEDYGYAKAGSTSYPFYIDLETSEGLMLGQHVYIEADNGQENEVEGVWLETYYINDIDTNPYVWAANGKNKLEKRYIVLGDYDEELSQYNITSGLSGEDMITYPDVTLKEGMSTAKVDDEHGLGLESNDSTQNEDFNYGDSSAGDFDYSDGAETETIPPQESGDFTSPDNAFEVGEDAGTVTDDMSGNAPGAVGEQ